MGWVGREDQEEEEEGKEEEETGAGVSGSLAGFASWVANERGKLLALQTALIATLILAQNPTCPNMC